MPIELLVQELTDREKQVYDLAIWGKSNKEIATLLRITPRTVKFHLAAIFRKFGVSNRLELILAEESTAARAAPRPCTLVSERLSTCRS